MTELVPLSLAVLVGYLVGAVPFGYLVGRWRGIDILAQGSGNIGATNVGRTLGPRFGILVFVLDCLKGALPTLAGVLAERSFASELPKDVLPVTAGVSAFLGHLFPVYLRFRGGKGVATGAGAVAVLVPLPTLGALLAWLVVVSSSRYVSLASLCAAAALCILRFLLTPHPLAAEHRILTLFCVWAAALVFIRHRSNVNRLVAGKENRLGDSSLLSGLARTLHVLAVGLWFGTGVFFSFVVGFALFGTFETEAEKQKAERPLWFPLPELYEHDPPSEKFPDPLRKEQGTRAAGFAITPLFDWYFIIQAVCGLVALGTALRWSQSGLPARIDTARTWVLAAALWTVAIGWWLSWEVSLLRVPRNDRTDALLKSTRPTKEQIDAAEQARSRFGTWHGISVLVNLLTLVLVTGAMAMTAQLPAEPESPEAP